MIDKEFLEELHSILIWARQTDACFESLVDKDIDRLIIRIKKRIIIS